MRGGNEVLPTSTFVICGQTREAVAANFLTNPAGRTGTFTGAGTNNLVTTEGGEVNGVTVGASKLSGEDGSDLVDGGAGNDSS